VPVGDNSLSQEQYNSLQAHVTDLGVRYIKTGFGWFTLHKAFDDFCERSGANKGINDECSIGRRKLMAQSVCIKAISRLDRVFNNRLEAELYQMAENYHSDRPRGMCR
jgi:hypothetical protein